MKLTIAKAKEICQNFANIHDLVFKEDGECGFGRECVGFLHGDNWVSFNPMSSGGDYEPIKGFQCESAYAPEGVESYHKFDCLAVLGRGPKAIKQLAVWVQSIEAAGNVEIATYLTGATGIQARVSGITGKALLCGERK